MFTRIRVGDSVRYIGADDEIVNFGGNDDPRGILIERGIYVVQGVRVFSSHTWIFLEEEPEKKFNSVCFEVV
jgi:hypothetical protein